MKWRGMKAINPKVWEHQMISIVIGKPGQDQSVRTQELQLEHQFYCRLQSIIIANCEFDWIWRTLCQWIWHFITLITFLFSSNWFYFTRSLDGAWTFLNFWFFVDLGSIWFMGNHDPSPAMRCQVFNLNQFLSMTKKLTFETKKHGNKLEICSKFHFFKFYKGVTFKVWLPPGEMN